MQSNVPSFSSFRFNPVQQQTDRSLEERDSRPRRHRHHQRHRHASDDSEQLRSDRNSARERSGREARNGNSSKLNDGDGIYVIDRRGDAGNTAYGRNSSQNLPAYHPPLSRLALGFSTHSLARDNIPLKPLSSLSREERKRLRNEPLHLQLESTGLDSDSDFISVKAKTRKLRGQEETGLDHQPQSESSDFDDAGLTADQDSQRLEGDRLRAINERLAQRTREFPTDVEPWLEYIAFQDTWQTAAGASTFEESKAVESTGLAHVKLSMYNKALKHLPENEKLLAGRMLEFEKSYETDKVLLEWENVAKASPRSLNLRIGGLNSVQSSKGLFDFRKVQKSFSQQGVLSSGSFSDHSHTLIRLVSCCKEAGFSELSTALWQAALERTFGAYRSAGDDSFSEFWDGEDPRFAESAPSHVSTRSQLQSLRSKPSGSQSTVLQWLEVEQANLNEAVFPGRSDDEVNEDFDDPVHTVFFSDLAPFTSLSTGHSEVELISAFLFYHNLPQLPFSLGPEPWREDVFLHSYFLDDLVKRQQASGGLDPDMFQTVDFITIPHVITTPLTLLMDSNDSFSVFTGANSMLERQLEFVMNTLASLVQSHPEWPYLQMYYVVLLARMSTDDSAAAKSTVKALIKNSPGSLLLYHAHALLEAQAGRTEESERTLLTTLKMSGRLCKDPAAHLHHASMLAHTWIWLSLRRGDYAEAQTRTLDTISFLTPEQQQPAETTAKISNASKTLQILAAECLSTPSHDSLITWAYLTGLTMLLSYLFGTQPSALGPAVPNLEAASSAVSVSTSAIEAQVQSTPTSQNSPATLHFGLELLHQSQAQLILQHMHASPRQAFSPRPLRAVAAHSAALFPRNTLIQTLQSELGRFFHLDDRVRKLVADEQLSSTPGLTLGSTISSVLSSAHNSAPSSTLGSAPSALDKAISDIHAELQRWSRLIRALHAPATDSESASAGGGSTQHSVRAAFERALALPGALSAEGTLIAQGSKCSALWACYVDWEARLGAFEARGYVKEYREQLGYVKQSGEQPGYVKQSGEQPGYMKQSREQPGYIKQSREQPGIAHAVQREKPEDRDQEQRHRAKRRRTMEKREGDVLLRAFARIRDVLLRGFGEMPWNKQFALAGLGVLRDWIEGLEGVKAELSEELREEFEEVARAVRVEMLDRGLRVMDVKAGADEG